ncbi:hypothetical protein GGR58DRAFT_470590 [Xylaria digitata]|nr:hypothetical protein GGR58DRAFT_470590 [Xylaria digitata]
MASAFNSSVPLLARGSPKSLAKPHGVPPLTMDHIIALDVFPSQNLVVGFGRPSSMWDGRKLANGVAISNAELRGSLRELAHNCSVANTQYGYIQTDQDMVVCCCTINNGYWNVAIMPILWSKHGDGVLTTGLALWYLCMLAMSDGYRNIMG